MRQVDTEAGALGQSVDDLAGGLRLLAADIGEQALAELIGLLRQTAQGQMNELGAAIAATDWTRAERLAHSLRSSALLVGAQALADRFAGLERVAGLARAEPVPPGPAAAGQALAELTLALGQMLDALEHLHAGR